MKYSVQELIDLATYGIAEPLRKLIALHPPQNDLNRALVAASAFGKDNCVELLMAVADPKSNDSQAFRSAVRNNSLSCVDILMPVSDVAACSSEALRIAAAEGFSHYVDMFIPLASVEECTQALVEAVRHNNSQCVDLLAPHLNQAALLKIISKSNLTSDALSSLYTLMAQHQHTLLKTEVVDQAEVVDQGQRIAHVSRKI